MSDSDREIQNLKLVAYILGGVIAVILISALFYRRWSRRKLKLADLNTKVRELELTAIRARMNPHFMYNCLNSIQNLVQKAQMEEAHLYLSKFASLIRGVLKYSAKEEISLAEELEILNEYVTLEQQRFHFDYEEMVDEEVDVHSVFIPPLLLQPLVENAIVHGLAMKKSVKRLNLEVSQPSDNMMCIVISDNGIGRKAAAQQSTSSSGNGLRFSEERLRLMAEKYNDQYIFEIDDILDGEGNISGTSVRICFAVE